MGFYLNKFFKKESFYKNIISVGFTVFVVKVFGFAKEMYVGESFGMTDELDVFFILILIPTFFNSVFLSSLKAVMIPNYIFAQKRGNTTFHNNLILQTILLGVILTCFLYFLSKPINTFLVRNYSIEIANKVFLYQNIILACIPAWTLSSLLDGLLDIKKRFAISAIRPIITSITVLVFLYFCGPSIKILVISFVVGSILELLFLLMFQPIKIDLYNVKFNNRDSIILYKQFIPKLLSGLIIGLNPVVDQLFTSNLAEGAISTLNYGNKLPAFAIGILTIAVGNVILPYFSEIADKTISEIGEFLKNKMIVLFFVGSFCTLFLLFFGPDLIALLFQRGEFISEDTEKVSLVLIMFSFQIPFYILDIMLVRFLTAFNLNSFNIVSSSISVIVNLCCNVLLIEAYGVAGVALSTSVVILLSFLTKLTYVNYIIKNNKLI